MISSANLTSEGSTASFVQFFNKSTEVNKLTIEWFIEHNAVCSICKKGINSFDINNLRVHPRLKVIICTQCSDQNDSTLRPDGNACNWCGNPVTHLPDSGEKVSFQVCRTFKCSNKLCQMCLSSNFTKLQAEKMLTNWECFDCNSEQIQPHQRYTEYLMQFARSFRQPLLMRQSVVTITETTSDKRNSVQLIDEMKNFLVQLETQPIEDVLSDDILKKHIQLAEKVRLELEQNDDDSSRQKSVPAVSDDALDVPTVPVNGNPEPMETTEQRVDPESIGIYIKPEPVEGVVHNSNTDPASERSENENASIKMEPEATQPIEKKSTVDSSDTDTDGTVDLGREQPTEQHSSSKPEHSDVNHLLGDVSRRCVNEQATQILTPSVRKKAPDVKQQRVKEEPFLSSADEADEVDEADDADYSVDEQPASNVYHEEPLIIVSSEDDLLSFNSPNEDEPTVCSSAKANRKRIPSDTSSGSSSSDDFILKKRIPSMPSTSVDAENKTTTTTTTTTKTTKKKKKTTKKNKEPAMIRAKKRTFISSSEEEEERKKHEKDHFENLESASSSNPTSPNSTKENSPATSKSAQKKRKLENSFSSSASNDDRRPSNSVASTPKKFSKQSVQVSKTPPLIDGETWIISSEDEAFVAEASSKPVSKVKSECSPSIGRKNIREMMTGAQLSKATLEANSKEKERRKRLEEMQKKYNGFEASLEQNSESVKCVLEFDLNTKQPLVQVHEELSRRLKLHQVEGIKFLYQNIVETLDKLRENGQTGSGAILGHCMGLGKTFQIVCFLHTLMTHPELKKHFKTILILSPLNVIATWQEEIQHWIERNPKIEQKLQHHSLHKEHIPRLRLAMLSKWQRIGGIMLMTPNLLTSLLGRTTEAGKRGRKKFPEGITFMNQFKQHICDPGPQLLIVDEGHTLKKSSTQLTQIVLAIKTRRKILLTGTPLQNNLTEYFTMVSIVSPFLLGTKTEFGNRFENPIMNGQYKNSTEADIRKMRQRASVLNRLLEKVVHRRDLSVLQKILPPRHDYVISMRLSALQEVLYGTFLKMLIQKAEQQQVATHPIFKNLLQDFVLLRSIWTHPKLLTMPKKTLLKKQAVATVSDMLTFDSITNEGHGENISKDWYKPHIKGRNLDDVTLGPKILILFDIIQNCGMIGDKLVVFCTQLSALDLVEVLLRLMNDNEIGEGSWITNRDYFRMDGQTNADDRHRYFKAFNDSSNMRARLFLVSTNAGKLGSTLTGANRMVLLDTSWNPADDNQAVYRIYRIGQHKPVFIYRFVSFGTMEEKIYARNILKESTSRRVLDDSNMDRHFTHEDVRDLYTFTPYVESDRVMPSVPKDKMLAELILRHKDIIVKVHEHQQMLQNLEDDLSEEDRRVAWDEYEREKQEPVAETPVPFASFLTPTLANAGDSNCVQRLSKEIQELDLHWTRSDVSNVDRLRIAPRFRNVAKNYLEQVLKSKELMKQELSNALKRRFYESDPRILHDMVTRMRLCNDAENWVKSICQKIDQLISRVGLTPIPKVGQPANPT